MGGIGGFFKSLKKAFSGFGHWVKGAYNSVKKEIINPAIKTIGSVGKSVLGTVGKWGDNITQGYSGLLSGVGGGVKGLATGIGNGVGGLGKGVGQGVSGLGSGVGQGISSFGNSLPMLAIAAGVIGVVILTRR
jgi:phage-related protein